jgi:hypothetical protein
LMLGYNILSSVIRLWWLTPKRECLRRVVRCKKGGPCKTPVVWDGHLQRPFSGRCRTHYGRFTSPKVEEGRWRIERPNRALRRCRRPGTERGKSKSVTQHGDKS